MASKTAAAEARLAVLQEQLQQIEKLKKMENSVRKEIAKLEEELPELESADHFHGKDDKDHEVTVKSPVLAPKGPKSPAFGVTPKDTAEESRKKRMKAINKKLQQIAGLKEKPRDGLDADAKAKLASEAGLLKELKALEAGEAYERPDESDEEAPTADLPTDPAEREKKLKALNKKLQQIQKLKATKGELDTEARQKVASETRVIQEIAALENGDTEVVFVPKDPQEEMAEQKADLEKKLKAVRKKLQQIEKLQEAGGELDAEAAAKVANQKALNKEAHQLEERLGAINRSERARVEERLGWETQNGGKKGKK